MYLCNARNSDKSPSSIAELFVHPVIRFIILPILPPAGTLTTKFTTRSFIPCRTLSVNPRKTVRKQPACFLSWITVPTVYTRSSQYLVVFLPSLVFLPHFADTPATPSLKGLKNAFPQCSPTKYSWCYLVGRFFRLSKRGWGSLKNSSDWARDASNSSPSRDIYVSPVRSVFDGMYEH